jgi:histidinol-phosphate/aromatic aminotransferase/cobyric acid decarboxylase-like protein
MLYKLNCIIAICFIYQITRIIDLLYDKQERVSGFPVARVARQREQILVDASQRGLLKHIVYSSASANFAQVQIQSISAIVWHGALLRKSKALVRRYERGPERIGHGQDQRLESERDRIELFLQLKKNYLKFN